MESCLRPIGCLLKRRRPSYVRYFILDGDDDDDGDARKKGQTQNPDCFSEKGK
jgi:hypothetical protein